MGVSFCLEFGTVSRGVEVTASELGLQAIGNAGMEYDSWKEQKM